MVAIIGDFIQGRQLAHRDHAHDKFIEIGSAIMGSVIGDKHGLVLEQARRIAIYGVAQLD